MNNEHEIIARHEALLKECSSKWRDILGMAHKLYSVYYIKDWEYTSKKCITAYKVDLEKVIKKHNINTKKLSNTEKLYGMKEFMSFLQKRSRPEFQKRGGKFPIAGVVYTFEDVAPYLSLNDRTLMEGIKLAWKDAKSELGREGIYTLEDAHEKFSYIASLIEDSKTTDQMLADKKSLKDTLLSDPKAAEIITQNPSIEEMVDAFSTNLDYTKKTLNNRNPNLGTYSKNRADQFAIDMGEHLSTLEKEGITSIRKIAKRFNELGIKSNLGKSWHPNSVAVLLRRREEMGLNDDENGNEPDIPTAG